MITHWRSIIHGPHGGPDDIHGFRGSRTGTPVTLLNNIPHQVRIGFIGLGPLTEDQLKTLREINKAEANVSPNRFR